MQTYIHIHREACRSPDYNLINKLLADQRKAASNQHTQNDKNNLCNLNLRNGISYIEYEYPTEDLVILPRKFARKHERPTRNILKFQNIKKIKKVAITI